MQNAPFVSQKPLTRYGYIDSLRGIAILFVIIAHTGFYTIQGLPGWFTNITAIDVGPRGVQLFYVVSAFTLCLTYFKREEKEKHVIRNFYVRRFFRIAPLFYLAVIYYLWQSYFFHQTTGFSWANILSTFSFTNGFSPAWINNIVFGGWSVAVETSFYLIFPLLFYFLKSLRRSLIFTFIAMILMQILRLSLLNLPGVYANGDMQTFTFEFFPSQLPVFLFGISAFILLHNGFLTKHDKKLIFSFLLLCGFCVLVGLLLGSKIIAGHYIYGLLFAGLLILLSKYQFILLVNPFIEFLGKISFSLYLSHIAVLTWLAKLNALDLFPTVPFIDYLARFIILFSLSVAVSSLLYIVIEQPGIRLGKKIIDHFEKKPTALLSKTES